MRIAQLSLINFRNYHQLNIAFSGGIKLPVGPQWSGQDKPARRHSLPFFLQKLFQLFRQPEYPA